MMKRLLALLLIVLILPVQALAQARSLALVRDLEIETYLKTFSAPILESAGLYPDAVKFFLVNSEEINAFVMGGQNIFVHTGLMMQVGSAGALIGVIAHETGHIAGGHLTRGSEAMENASVQAMMGYLLAAAAAAAGQGKVAAGVAGASQSMALNQLMSFSRSQEQAADQAAISYLQQNRWPAEGMLNVLELLRRRESLNYGGQSQYLRSHPLSRDRIEHIRSYVQNREASGLTYPPEFDRMYARIVAKLNGFLADPDKVLAQSEGKADFASLYGASVAYFRKGDLNKALAVLDGLLKESPGDPYVLELKGQFLFERGKVKEAIPFYQQALDKLGGSGALIQVALARCYLAEGGVPDPKKAIGLLEQALNDEGGNAMIYEQMAIAYGKSGQKAMASLYQAELALIRRQYNEAIQEAKEAEQALPANSPSWLRAKEVSETATRQRKEAKEQGRQGSGGRR